MSNKIQRGGLDGFQGFLAFLLFAGVIASIVVPIIINASKKKEPFEEKSHISSVHIGIIIAGIFVGLFIFTVIFVSWIISSH